MDDTRLQTVIGVFPNRGQAEGAIDELWHAGYRHDQIGILIPGEGVHKATTMTEELEEQAGDGAVNGALTGGAIGAVAGALVVAIIPGVGPILAGGLLAGIATGAAAGAAGGAWIGPFIAGELGEEEAKHYQNQFTAGRTLVVVKTELPDETTVILKSHGGEVKEQVVSGSNVGD